MDNLPVVKFKLKRDIFQKECSWLERDFKKDEIVFEYPLYTYGVVSNNGIACSEKEWESPFFELPKDSLEKI
jgi:hypothetical protein